MNAKRARIYGKNDGHSGPVIYWMSRDQRVHDHWGMIFAQKLALSRQAPMCVVFSLVSDFLGATLRQYDFMLRGLAEVEQTLGNYNIPFFLLNGPANKTLPTFLLREQAAALITDFNPLRIHQNWLAELRENSGTPIYQVDSRNIIPCWSASSKQEYAAYTIRPKIHKNLPEFLEEFPPLKTHPIAWPDNVRPVEWTSIRNQLLVNRDVTPVDWLIPGEKQARKALNHFIREKLNQYDQHRNDPLKDSLSNLSPYLHFGQIASQRVALEVKKESVNEQAKESFLEELIVRRELADNYCFYNSSYDQPEGFPRWAQKTLDDHQNDERPYLYDLSELESANTHDDLWNACQQDMMINGKLHGYLRMYWAKKILEWSSTAKSAQKNAIYLNDKYFLDGRDPNGYTGIAWSIGGVHDRAWFERPIFGKVRYMNKNGCRRKFDVKAYIAHVYRNKDV